MSDSTEWKCRHAERKINDADEETNKSNLPTNVLPPSAKIDNPKMITLGLLTQKNIEVVRRINRSSLPVNYGEMFYSMVVDNRELSRLAFVCDIPVGAVAGRLVFTTDDDVCDEDVQPNKTEDKAPPSLIPINNSGQWELTTSSNRINKKTIDTRTARFCILCLAVLPAYRRSSIGRMLVNWVIRRCAELNEGDADTATGNIPGLQPGQAQVKVTEVFLHVWTTNHTAIEFYKSMGFEEGSTIKGYYKNLSPPDCIVFKKKV